MRNKIIAELYNSAEFKSCISKMRPLNLQDDLRAEVALILCEMPEDRIIMLHETGALKFFTVRIILNLTKSNTSTFYKKYRLQQPVESVEIPDVPEEPINLDISRKESQALLEVDNLYWYDRELIKLYVELGTYREVEKATGIPFASIYKTVQNACRIIKEKVA